MFTYGDMGLDTLVCGLVGCEWGDCCGAGEED